MTEICLLTHFAQKPADGLRCRLELLQLGDVIGILPTVIVTCEKRVLTPVGAISEVFALKLVMSLLNSQVP